MVNPILLSFVVTLFPLALYKGFVLDSHLKNYHCPSSFDCFNNAFGLTFYLFIYLLKVGKSTLISNKYVLKSCTETNKLNKL